MIRKTSAVREPESLISRLDWVFGAILYFSLAFVMIRFASEGHEIAAVWVANAALIGLLVSQRKPKWIRVCLSALIVNAAANLLTRGELTTAILFGIANIAEIVIATWLLRTMIGQRSVLSSLGVFGKFTLIGFLASIVGGFLGGAAAWRLFEVEFLAAWAAWSLSDTLGILVFTPFFLALFKGDYRRCIREKSSLQQLEAMALLIGTFFAAGAIFFVIRKVPIFILLVPTMLVTLRVGQLGTKAAVMLIAAVGLSSTFLETGLIYRANDYDEQILILQVFLFVLLFSSLPVAADLTARRRAAIAFGRREQELTQIAATDALTGLVNRSAFMRLAQDVLSQRQGRQICLITIDVDHFKRINDTFGHHAGDDALRHLASVASSHLRSPDILCRFGGDEFMLLLLDAGIVDAEGICGRLKESLRRRPVRLEDGTTLLLSVSCGIAVADEAETFSELSRRADIALYDAKNAGRGTYRTASTDRGQRRAAVG
ncbi:diguanylate cyclase [Aquamicrobium segne]|uniref:diguanylate cyclase n=1 Tax=Aquamicrobium segne TaxID=469547 RepID=A0ABW0H2V3_9HYPH